MRRGRKRKGLLFLFQLELRACVSGISSMSKRDQNPHGWLPFLQLPFAYLSPLLWLCGLYPLQPAPAYVLPEKRWYMTCCPFGQFTPIQSGVGSKVESQDIVWVGSLQLAENPTGLLGTEQGHAASFCAPVAVPRSTDSKLQRLVDCPGTRSSGRNLIATKRASRKVCPAVTRQRRIVPNQLQYRLEECRTRLQ
jgi:hypothetical protein